MAKANNLDLETVVVDTANPTKEFLALNPLSKVPVFVGSDGFVLSESIAVAVYRMLRLFAALPRYSSSLPSRPVMMI